MVLRKALSELILETRQQVQSFEPSLAEDVVSEDGVAPEAGRLVQSNHVCVAFGNVGDHLVQAEVIEAVVEHEYLRVLGHASASIRHLADEDRAELTLAVSPVEIHDADGAHR